MGPQKRLDRRLEEVAKAVGGGYCRLQMPLRPALGVRGTVAGHWLGPLDGAGGTSVPMHPWRCPSPKYGPHPLAQSPCVPCLRRRAPHTNGHTPRLGPRCVAQHPQQRRPLHAVRQPGRRLRAKHAVLPHFVHDLVVLPQPRGRARSIRGLRVRRRRGLPQKARHEGPRDVPLPRPQKVEGQIGEVAHGAAPLLLRGGRLFPVLHKPDGRSSRALAQWSVVVLNRKAGARQTSCTPFAPAASHPTPAPQHLRVGTLGGFTSKKREQHIAYECQRDAVATAGGGGGIWNVQSLEWQTPER